MPFTFSHPALVVPLLRQRRRWPWLSATGLLVGSVTPDFEKLFRLQLTSGYSHSLASLFYFSLPVGLALTFVWQGLLHKPVLRHLPTLLYSRLAGIPAVYWPGRVWRHPVGVLASIWLGAASHLLWDSFTHHNAQLVGWFPWLERVVVLPGYHVYTYSFLALLSSIVGGLVIAWAVWRLPVRAVGQPPPAAAVWRFWLAAGLVAAMLLGGWVRATHPSHSSLAVAVVSASLLGVALTSAGSRLLEARRLQ